MFSPFFKNGLGAVILVVLWPLASTGVAWAGASTFQAQDPNAVSALNSATPADEGATARPGVAPTAVSAPSIVAPNGSLTGPVPAKPATAPVSGNESLVPPTLPGAASGDSDEVTAPPLPPPNNFAGAPPVPGTMRLMAEGEAPEEYGVEPGDTLFDICDQLLDEAGYWPKLWALNPEIKNPHFIFPNMRLRFYPGDDDTPPYLQVVAEDDVIPIDKANLDEGQLVAEKVIFPVDKVMEEQVVDVVGPRDVEALEDSVLTGGQIYNGSDFDVYVPGFIYSQEKEAAGHVLIGRQGEEAAMPGAEVQLQADSGLAVGSLYTVLRPAADVKNPDTGDFVGYRYYYVANARVAKDIGDGIFRAVIEDGRLSVYPDDLVVNYISTRRAVPISEDAVGGLRPTDATIVAWEYAEQENGARGNFAFLDKGTSQGIQAGMYLPVFSTPGFLSQEMGDADLPTDYEQIGSMRIIDATDAGSVGYVMRSISEMRIGDRTTGKAD